MLVLYLGWGEFLLPYAQTNIQLGTFNQRTFDTWKSLELTLTLLEFFNTDITRTLTLLEFFNTKVTQTWAGIDENAKVWKK